MATIYLKPKREKSLLRKHPWVFSGAIARIEGSAQSGDTVMIRGADGKLYGTGAWSEHSQIRVRVWSFDPAVEISESFFRTRLQRALEARKESVAVPSEACRLVNAESDGLPGIIVDRYADFIVCQFLSSGAERWKQTIVSLLDELLPNKGIYERSDADVRNKEGLQPATGVLRGEHPPALVQIHESGCSFLIDIETGHKTGFYLDQRINRSIVAACAKNADVLNCFSYTGGFAVAALMGGARSVINIDSSASVLELALKNCILNHIDDSKVTNICRDVFVALRQFHREGRTFDLVVLDPPKFADSQNTLPGACRGYKDINMLAFKILRPGGFLCTFSCSGLLGRDLFQKIVADAALDANREARILHILSQSPDHGIATCFPEGSYLKGFICQVW